MLRVVRSADVPDAAAVLGEHLAACTWFMDHRNADGSHAEMCGNGIRLFLHVLVSEGLLDAAECETGVLVGTRGGPRRVGTTGDGSYWVDMGPARPFGSGARSSPAAASPDQPSRWAIRTWPASPTRTSTHSTCRSRRRFDEALFPEGVNVEFVTVLADDGATGTSGSGSSSVGWGRPARAERARAQPPTPR